MCRSMRHRSFNAYRHISPAVSMLPRKLRPCCFSASRRLTLAGQMLPRKLRPCCFSTSRRSSFAFLMLPQAPPPADLRTSAVSAHSGAAQYLCTYPGILCAAYYLTTSLLSMRFPNSGTSFIVATSPNINMPMLSVIISCSRIPFSPAHPKIMASLSS